MKKFKNYITTLFLLLFSICLPACSTKKTSYEDVFVGIAIYQNYETNAKWNEIKNNPNKINNLVETKNNKIEYNETIPYLFYVYSNSKIIEKILNPLSNTTTNEISVNENEICFEFERIVEDTDILIYYIYKDKNSNYYLKFAKAQDNLTEETTIINLENIPKLSKNIVLTLQTNLPLKNGTLN